MVLAMICFMVGLTFAVVYLLLRVDRLRAQAARERRTARLYALHTASLKTQLDEAHREIKQRTGEVRLLRFILSEGKA